MGEKENVLAKEDCEGLMSLIDHDSYSNAEEPEFQDIQKYIDESDLVSVIGKVSGGCHDLYSHYRYMYSASQISFLTLQMFPLLF